MQPPGAEVLHDRRTAARADARNSGAGLRLRRSSSRLERAEAGMQDAGADPDAAFIFFRIAFNALCAGHTGKFHEASERGAVERRSVKVCRPDTDRVVHNAIRPRWPGPIGLLPGNPCVYRRFWTDKGKPGAVDGWQARLAAGRKRVPQALARQDACAVLCEVFDRLHGPRNRLVRGGARDSAVNRDQVKDGRAIVASLVSRFVAHMLANHAEDRDRPHLPPEFAAGG